MTNQVQSPLPSPPEKLDRLQALLRELGTVVVAYSGGVDSTFLLRVAAETLGDHCRGVIGRSASLPEDEMNEAVALARGFGARVDILTTHEMDDPNYVSNPQNRCYFCKSELFGRLANYAAAEGLTNIVDGANLDDRGDWRPGAQAARERHVRSPLQEVGLTKADIRLLSQEYGLPTWDKPEAACLASRVPYGTAVTVEVLSQVERAERYLKQQGFRQLRVRHHDNIARIELAPEEIPRFLEPEVRDDIVAALKEIGYTFVTLDLAGYRRGSLNVHLTGVAAATS